MAASLKCPSCRAYLPTNGAGAGAGAGAGSSAASPRRIPPGTAIVVRYTAEGGTDELDFLPNVVEEAYLGDHPEARPARAIHVMCAEGDVAGIVDVLQDFDAGRLADILGYQDPLAGLKSALHVAVDRSQVDVAWLLLWLVSRLPGDAFPPDARRDAEALRIRRLPVAPGRDIRALRNESGQTAEQVARRLGGAWLPLLEAGVLRS